jgi:polyhydroxyalkanoate synthesis regulator phasin
VDKAWQRYLDLASGLTQVTRNRAEQVIRALVKQGEIAAERTEKAVDELLRRSELNRKALAAVVRSETERAVARLGLARQADVNRLERKVEQVEQPESAGTRARQAPRPATKKAAKKSTKKAAKKSTKKVAKKTVRKSAGGGTA